ncbi:hypothetical protein STRTUCAR8_02251, partial [Streptomyces turgidiscabies Car8]
MEGVRAGGGGGRGFRGVTQRQVR